MLLFSAENEGLGETRCLMKSSLRFLAILAAVVASAELAYSQADDACSETGGTVWLTSKVVYGRVVLNGIEPGGKMPKVSVILLDRERRANSFTLSSSGKFCFRDIDGSGGTLIVEVEGAEVGRQSLPTGPSGPGPKQFQQDFEVWLNPAAGSAKPGLVSAKYRYPRSAKNVELFEEANAAIKAGDRKKAVQLLNNVVGNDPADFLAWAQLGSVHTDLNDFSGSEAAYQKALIAKPDFGIAMMQLGRVYLVQNRIAEAIQSLESATKTDPSSARSFQLLGEAYILDRKGTLGVAALNEAIRLEPIAMADSHLLMARLYDRAGIKHLAAREYQLFLEKVPKHPDAKKYTKYIQDNPEKPN